jgi:inosose dehydratase
MFRPLGQGDVGIEAMVRTLEAAGYDGWYVLEQDVMLDGPSGGDVSYADVRASLDFLERVTA